MLYVFVDIKIDAQHFVETVKFNCDKNDSLALVSTIQFVPTLQVGPHHSSNSLISSISSYTLFF